MPMDELLLMENPWYGNPRSKRRGRRRSNPAMSIAKVQSQWLQGVDMVDAAAAAGGLALSAYLPGAVIKESTTMTNKFLRLIVGIGAAVGAGFVARNISSGAGKAAIIGGIAGTVVQAMTMFTGAKIGTPQLQAGGVGRYPAPVTESPFRGVRLT